MNRPRPRVDRCEAWLDERRRWLAERERTAALIVVAGLTIGFAVLALTRRYFNFGPETDYLGAFVPEARRLLAGEPLLMEWHPPLYQIVLAVVQSVTGDWVLTGLLVTLVSTAATAALSFFLFRKIEGRWAAWGAVVGLAVSSQYVEYSATASTDLPFLALFYGSCFLVFSALRSQDTRTWMAAGAVIGLSLLLRTNGLSLVFLALVPLFGPSGRRMRGAGALTIGVLAPLAAWVVLAAATGSPLLPSGSHANLAATYFSDRVSGDDLGLMEERFDSMWAVLTYDPVHIARTYVRDLYTTLQNVLLYRSLISYPLNLLVLPGLLFLLARGRRALLLFLVLAILSQLGLVNLKQFTQRYYLFLVPLFGAATGVCAGYVWRSTRRTETRWLLGAVAALALLIGIRGAVLQAHDALHELDGELGDAVPAVVQVRPSCERLFARKPHVPFYADCPYLIIPSVASVEVLRDSLRARSHDGPGTYVYFGAAERALRPELGELAEPSAAPVWLRPVARGEDAREWVLYHYREDE